VPKAPLSEGVYSSSAPVMAPIVSALKCLVASLNYSLLKSP